MAYTDMGEEEEVFGINIEEDGYFGNYDDDSIGGYDEFSSEDRKRELGENVTFDNSLTSLLEELKGAKSAGVGTMLSKKRRAIDADICDKFIHEIKTLLPKEIAEARTIISTKTKIIDEANAHYEKVADEADAYSDQTCAAAEDYATDTRMKADDYSVAKRNEADKEYDRIIDDAEAEAVKMTSEHEITARAHLEEERIIAEATEFANKLIENTNKSIDEYVESVNNWGRATMRRVYEYCVEALNKGIDISNQNATALDTFLATVKDEIRATAADIGEFKG